MLENESLLGSSFGVAAKKDSAASFLVDRRNLIC